ncbi:MAG: hypothetical protein IK062_10760 [Selenomonadaceae bacterium]|nr:hypothetical protein [Selenomonadaceae bacterium]
MATREENLKKINDELEKMSDEELEQVAGGSHAETASDSYLLYKLGLLDNHWDAIDIATTPGTSIERKIYDAWQKVGIGFGWSGGTFCDNNYYYGQKCLSQKEAWEVAIHWARERGINFDPYGDSTGGDF